MAYSHLKERRKRTKARLVAAFGGKCGICEYDACISALDFHHIDSNEKEFSVSSYGVLNWDKLVEEVKKCVCLCCRCHREVHAKVTQIPLDIPRFCESFTKYKKARPKDRCTCGSEKFADRKFCSRKCSDASKRKIDWSNVDLVSQIESGETYVSLGKKYNVSDNTVKKWYKIQLMG